MFDRSLRRHHLERLKVKRSKRDRLFGYLTDSEGNRIGYRSVRSFENREEHKHRIGLYGHTACLCSCAMCGNPRKYRGELTLRELSSLELFELELGELT